jgi:hypothetical protein
MQPTLAAPLYWRMRSMNVRTWPATRPRSDDHGLQPTLAAPPYWRMRSMNVRAWPATRPRSDDHGAIGASTRLARRISGSS